MRKRLSYLLIIFMFTTILAFSPASRASATTGDFQIGIYWPPPAAYTNDTQYDYLKDASINYIINVDSTDIDSQAQNMAVLAKCATRGIKYVVCDSAYAPVSSLTNAQIDAYTNIYKNNSALGGFYVKDEPGAGEFSTYAAKYNRFLIDVPGSNNYLNLLPSTDIAGYIDPFITTVGVSNLPYLCHDKYAWEVPSGISSSFFDVLRAYRSAAMQRNLKMANFLQSTSWGGGSRRPNENEMRYDVFTNLAYGAKALYWFTWWQPTGQGQTFTPSIMNADGTKTNLYVPVQTLNSQIKQLGPTLMGLTSQAVYHSGVLASGCDPVPSGFFWQPNSSSDNDIISYFTNASGRSYVMVVNRTLTDTKTLTFKLNSKPASVTEVSKTTGQEVSTNYNPSTGVISNTFFPGEGRLYALPIGYPILIPTYKAHVQDICWMNSVYSGGTAGTVSLVKQMEAVQIYLTNCPAGAHIKYQTHVTNIGWQNWVYDGGTAGTTGMNYSLQAIKIMLEGAPANYHVKYRAHVRNIGWQAWVTDGAQAGTTGQNLPIEALEVIVYVQ